MAKAQEFSTVVQSEDPTKKEKQKNEEPGASAPSKSAKDKDKDKDKKDGEELVCIQSYGQSQILTNFLSQKRTSS